jgi:hypothetical protein
MTGVSRQVPGGSTSDSGGRYQGRQPEVERPVLMGAIDGGLQARNALREAPELKPLR